MNKRLLLVDDVFTTGATVNECARVLKKSGAGEIIVILTLARVGIGMKGVKLFSDLLRLTALISDC